MKNKAFTTVEMLVATALAVVLMIGVLRVVGSVNIQTSSPELLVSDTSWSDNLVRSLRWDLIHAQSVHQEDNKLTLMGYGWLDRESFKLDGEASRGAISHRPVQVVYSLTSDGMHNWLIRRQTDLDELTNRNAWSQPVAHGVKSFALRLPGDPGSRGDEAGWLGRPRPVPDRVRLVVRMTQPAQADIDQTIVIR